MIQRARLLFLLPSLLAGPALAGQEPLTFAAALEHEAALVAEPPPVRWIPGGHDYAFARPGAENTEELVRGTAGGEPPQPVCTARQVLAALGSPVPADKPAALPAWSWFDDKTLRLLHTGGLWHWQPGAEKAERVLPLPPDLARRDEGPAYALCAGDAALACVREHDLWVLERGGRQRRLTWDGSVDVVYGGAAHRAEFGIQGGLFWSPDGRFLAFYRENLGPIDPYPYQNLDVVPPRPRSGRYPMAGRVHSRVQVGVYDRSDASLRWLEPGPEADVYWTNVAFTKDGLGLTVALVNRGQDRMQLHRFDVRTGKRTAVLLEEQDPEWVEPRHPPSFLPDGRFLHWSARDGQHHLYLHGADGQQLLQVTRGAFDVQALLGFDAGAAGIYFAASGEDPRQRHLFYARLDGSEVKQVTRERGTHRCQLAPDGRFVHDVWSNLETPPAPRLLDLASGAAQPLPAAADPRPRFQLPQQRELQVKIEGDLVLYGHLLLPAVLPEGRKLPVVLYVYGGPQVQLVTDSWLAGAPAWLHGLAASGYAVARLDNRGTPNRGIAFEQCVHRRLGTLEVQDQLLAVEQLKALPFVDPARIGVTGWSYGGYLTLRLLLLAPDSFACGVSGAPVTDWAQYETGFTERYMDTPAENPDGYRAASCLPLAASLKAALLLAHGTDDRTVMWSQSLAFVDRCIEAGVQFAYLPYPMQVHGLRGADRRHFLQAMKRHFDAWLKPGS